MTGTYVERGSLQGPTGPQGPIGLPGVNAVANDTATAGYIASPSSLTRAAIEEYVGPSAVTNPETEMNAAVLEVVDDALGGSVDGLTRVFKGALTNIAVARPSWGGIVDWWINEGDPNPTNYLDDTDVITVVAAFAEEDLPGFADTFNRANGAPVRTPSGRKAWNVGSTSGTPTWSIVSNRIALTAAATGNAVLYADGKDADGVLTATCVSAGSVKQTGVVFRLSGPTSYLYLSRAASGDNRWTLFKRISGTSTVIQYNPSGTLIANGDVVEVTLDGTTVEVRVNGLLIITATVSDQLTATNHGLYGGNSTLDATWDDIEFVAAT